MGFFVAIGLLLQAAALTLLFRRLRGRWLIHVGAVFIVLAAAFHGLNEILLWLFPDRDPYRRLISPDYVGQFVLWISVALLLFTLTYLGALRAAPQRISAETGAGQLARIGRVFDWRLLILAAALLMALTVAGNGYLSGVTLESQPVGTAQGLALQFFLLVVPLTGFATITRFGRYWFLPVLLAQSTAIAVTGERFAILIAAAVILYGLARVGVSISRGQLIIAGVTFVLITLIITSARAAEGRFTTTADIALRLDFLTAGIGNLRAPTTRDAVSADLGYRFDGNSFGAMELEALNQWHQPVLGPRPLLNDLLLAIPSFLNPGKTLAPRETRSDKEYAEVYLGLPLPFVAPGTHQDILPTQLGAIIGLLGPWGLLFAALLLGASFGMADRWLLGQLTPSRLLLSIGLLSCALSYEGSWDVYSITFRGILLLLPLVWILQSRRPGRAARRIESRVA